MTRARTTTGIDTDGLGAPNWQPLEELVGGDVVGDFMWMYQVELDDGGLLQAYKHIDTRRYIHLDSDGRAFVYLPPDRYLRADPAEVLAEVFATLPGLALVTDEQIEASHRVVERLSSGRKAHRRRGRRS